MRIGLCSELGRQHIVEMRKEIRKSGSGSSESAMKSFRLKITNSLKEYHLKILNSSDFYSLSSFRDLLLHVQEHRFTIPKLNACLAKLDLKFCDFDNPQIVQGFRQSYTGTDDPYDLEKWQIYEENNPETFIDMYQFWCQKITSPQSQPPTHILPKELLW